MVLTDVKTRLVGQAGLEQGEELSGETRLFEPGGAESGAVGAPWPDDLKYLVEIWPDLTNDAIREILRIVQRR